MKENSTDSAIRDPFSGLELLTEDAFRSLGSMEAVEWEATPKKKTPVAAYLPGLALAIGITAIAIFIQRLLPASLPLGAAALAMVFGIALRNGLRLPASISTGCRWIVSHLIPLAIVLVGAGMNLGILMSEGFRFLGFIIAAVAISAGAAILLSRFIGVSPRTALLIGAGTGICGSSAILAVAPVIDAEEDDILLSVGAINLIGLLAMFFCIGLASMIPISAENFGILTGTTIHAVPTVAAAAFDHSAEAGQIGTLVKMGRVALLVPFVFAVSAFWNRKEKRDARSSVGKKLSASSKFVPWFVWGFAATALLATLGLMPDLVFTTGRLFSDGFTIGGAELLTSAGKLLLALAMGAIGLQVGLKSMLRTGGRVVALSVIVWLLVTSLIGLILRFS